MKFTLSEGLKKLLTADDEGDTEIGDLMTENVPLALDVSLAIGEQEGEEGLSIILTSQYDPIDEEENGYILFSGFMFAAKDESMTELATRMVKALGINPDNKIWEDTDNPDKGEE